MPELENDNEAAPADAGDATPAADATGTEATASGPADGETDANADMRAFMDEYRADKKAAAEAKAAADAEAAAAAAKKKTVPAPAKKAAKPKPKADTETVVSKEVQTEKGYGSARWFKGRT